MATKQQISKPRCSCCRHPQRHAIEMAHVAGCSLEAIAVKFGTEAHPLHRASVHRHVRDHMTETDRASYLVDIPLAELAERAAKEGLSLLDYFALVRSTVVQQMLLAASVNDGHRTAVLAGRAVEVLREIGRLTGELSKLGSSISITNNVAIFSDPKFIELQAGLLTIARSHPGARADIIALLRGLDAGPSMSTPNSTHPPMIEGDAQRVA